MYYKTGQNKINGKILICEDCLDNKIVTCQICGNNFKKNDQDFYIKYDNHFYCDACYNQHIVKCTNCAQLLNTKNKNEYFQHDGDFYCNDCYEEIFYNCEICQKTCDKGEMYFTYDQNRNQVLVCQDCLGELQFSCEQCSTTINRYIDDYEETHNGEYICQKCYENHYVYCDGCNQVFRQDEIGGYDDNGVYCFQCYNQLVGVRQKSNKKLVDPQQEKDVKQYGHNTKIKVKLKKRLNQQQTNEYIGIQLQLQNSNDNAKQTTDFINQVSKNKKLICKSDGSLSDLYGVEIVTQPCTYNYHLRSFGWQNIFNLIKKYHMNNVSNSGLHYHLSKNNFSLQQLKGLDYFVNHCVTYLSLLGGRDYGNTYSYNPATPNKEQWGANKTDRFEAVNFENQNTVQLRFPQSTDNYNIFKKRLRMIHNICKLVKFFTFQDMKLMDQQGLTYIFKQLVKQL